MPIVGEAKETVQRFSKYIQELVELFKRFDIVGSRAPRNLWKATANGEFRKEWKRIWSDVAEHDGGKLSLTTVLAIIGAVLGGVGIAAFGGAIGVPLALLFAPVGYLLGAEIDSWVSCEESGNLSRRRRSSKEHLNWRKLAPLPVPNCYPFSSQVVSTLDRWQRQRQSG